jgi:hypothetical protein
MRTLKHLVILSLVVVVAVFLAAPSAMAKKQLTEDELDLITAAGEPMVIDAQGDVDYIDEATFTLTLGTAAQSSLQALTLNNVVGESQLANAFNIQAATGTVSNTKQTNDITQSWGSTLDYTFGFKTVAGVKGGDGGDGGGNLICAKGGKCNGIATLDANNAGGNGGAAAQGVIAGAVTSAYADVIIRTTKAPVLTVDAKLAADDVLFNDLVYDGVNPTINDTLFYLDHLFVGVGVAVSLGDADVNVDITPTYTLTMAENAQKTLLGLAINNIVGQAQVANALNIAGGNVAMNAAGPGFIGTSGGASGAQQANTVQQCRGTPCSRPAAPIAFSTK